MKKKTEMVLRRSRDQTPCEKLKMQQETQGMYVYVVRERLYLKLKEGAVLSVSLSCNFFNLQEHQ